MNLEEARKLLLTEGMEFPEDAPKEDVQSVYSTLLSVFEWTSLGVKMMIKAK